MSKLLVAQGLDVAAGVKQQFEADAKRIPGLHLLEGRFMVINQAMGTPKWRGTGDSYLREFIEEMKASGFAAQAPERATASKAPRWPRRQHRAAMPETASSISGTIQISIP